MSDFAKNTKQWIMKVAVMQPYTFPYLGYYQLVSAVDVFVFADDVNFIKNGWIQRNRILYQNEAYLITLPLIKQSQNKLIREVEINIDLKAYQDVLRTIRQAYKKAPYFDQVFPLVEAIMNSNFNNIADLAAHTVIAVSKYLGLKTGFLNTSRNFSHTKGLEKSARLITITKELGSLHYINPIGGKELYDPEFFEAHGVKLNFLQTAFKPYNQFGDHFIPGLSILDILMFNSVDEIHLQLNNYRLV